LGFVALPPAVVMEILNRRLLVVTGKGGVGKTTVASALAWQAAAIGKKVLLCELDAKGDLLASLQGVSGRASAPLSFAPREVHPGLHAMVMDPEESLKEYLRIYLRLPLVTRIGLLSNAFDFLANAAPGVREIVTIGKFAHEVRERHYDLVVVDATASGHIVGLLRAPQAINELVQAGLLRSQTAWILDILGDRALTGVVAVATPEELPVSETAELFANIASQTNLSVQAIVVNRVLPVPFTQAESGAFAALRARSSRGSSRSGLGSSGSGGSDLGSSGSSDSRSSGAAVAALGGVDEREADMLIRGVGLAEDLRTESLKHLAALRTIGSNARVPVALVAQLFGVSPGLPATMAVAEMLAEELP
jgi:anion-transporting  ArsA/GET3 family ATPase